MRNLHLSGALLLALLAGCLPVPDLRLGLRLPPTHYRLAPSAVQSAYVSLPGMPEPHTPPRYNRALYLRYFDPSQPRNIVLVLVPGIFGGATSLDILARQLVASTPGLEVWAVDRRANLLEDHAAAIRSLQTGDPRIAYNYYIKNAGTNQGFQPLPPQEVRFMGYWGLDVHLRDLHAIVRRAQKAAPTVILGGHSLGASLVSYYAAYDFGTDGNDPGYGDIDGLVLIDGALGRTGGFSWGPGARGIWPVMLVPSVKELEAGTASPYLTVGLTPGFYARGEAMALLARLAPQAPSPGGLLDFPASNMAVLGIQSDDEYGPVTLFGVSMGEATNAEFAGNLTAVILGGLEGVYNRSVVGVAPGHTMVRWTAGGTREYTDPTAFARSWLNPATDRNEWYFPLRLLQDAGQLDVALTGEEHFVPNAQVTTPTLALGAQRGLIDTLDGFATYINARPGSFFSSYILPGFTHIDIVSATHNPVVPLFQKWLQQLK